MFFNIYNKEETPIKIKFGKCQSETTAKQLQQKAQNIPKKQNIKHIDFTNCTK